MSSLIPGEPDPIDAEIRRLGLLRDRLWAAANDVDRLTPLWAGRSQEGFAEFQDSLARRWREAGDLHHEARTALERYRDVRLDLERRVDEIARRAAHGADPVIGPAAMDDIARLRKQLDRLAAQTAAIVDRCAEALASLHATTATPPQPDRVSVPTAPTAPMAAAPVPADPVEPPQPQASRPPDVPGAIDLDQTLTSGRLDDIDRDVRVLAVEILLGTHHVMPL